MGLKIVGPCLSTIVKTSLATLKLEAAYTKLSFSMVYHKMRLYVILTELELLSSFPLLNSNRYKFIVYWE